MAGEIRNMFKGWTDMDVRNGYLTRVCIVVLFIMVDLCYFRFEDEPQIVTYLFFE